MKLSNKNKARLNGVRLNSRNWNLQKTIASELSLSTFAAQAAFEVSEADIPSPKLGRPVGTVGGKARLTDGGRASHESEAYQIGVISADAGE